MVNKVRRRRDDVVLGELADSTRRVRGLGSEPYGVLRLALNFLRSSPDVQLRENRKALGELRDALLDARVNLREASLLELESVNRRLVYKLVAEVSAVVSSNAKRLFGVRLHAEVLSEMRKTLRKFTAKRNLMLRLLTALEKLHGDYRHGVVHWRKKGNMPTEVVDAVLKELRGLSRDENVAYMLDSSARGGVHVHYLCSVATERKLKRRLGEIGGVQATSAPKALLQRWERREEPRRIKGFVGRDTTSYLAVKLTPGLQVPSIARKVREDLGGYDRELGRVVCHTKANRLALEARAVGGERRSRGGVDRTPALIQRGRDLLHRRERA